jgi:hypothetical protein
MRKDGQRTNDVFGARDTFDAFVEGVGSRFAVERRAAAANSD